MHLRVKQPAMRAHWRPAVLFCAACLAGAAWAADGEPAAPAAAASATVPAPKPPSARASEHETVSGRVSKSLVTVVYGRPHMTKKGTTEARTIWGGLVPYDKVWRAGADEATTLITEKDIEIGGVTVPAGAHTLALLPSESGASKLVIMNRLGQWGVPYQDGHDLARVDVQKADVETSVEQFTISIDGGDSGVLRMTWDKTQYFVPFTVKP